MHVSSVSYDPSINNDSVLTIPVQPRRYGLILLVLLGWPGKHMISVVLCGSCGVQPTCCQGSDAWDYCQLASTVFRTEVVI